MRVVRKVEARFRVGRAAAGIDAERAYFPIRWDGANHEEERDEPANEQEEAQLPASLALFRLLLFSLRLDGAPEWESHPAPTLLRGDYGTCFAAR
jgi:hypothetical protein